MDPNQELDRRRCRQHGHRPLPGLRHQRQRLTDAGRRGGRGQDPGHRGGRPPASSSSCSSPSPGLLRNLPIAILAAIVIAAALKLRRDRRRDAPVPGAALGVLAQHPRLRRRRRPRRHPRRRAGRRPVAAELRAPLVAAVQHPARASRRAEGLPRRRPPPRGARACPACSCSGSTRRCSSPTPRRCGQPSCTRAVNEAGRPVRWVVITAEPITDIDATGAAVLASSSTSCKPRASCSRSPS